VIWCEVLGIPEVSTTENFFDLGGHSILLHMVRDLVSERLRIDVALVDLFTYPTVHALARQLSGNAALPDTSGTKRSTERLRERQQRRHRG
jgi:hypothetical protein